MFDQAPSHQHVHPIVVAAKEPSELEAALRLEVERLTQDGWKPGSRPIDFPKVAGRPAWWWDVQLMGWTWSTQAGIHLDAEDLRLLRERLRRLRRDEVVALVRDLLQ